jgi:hypothetical protein
MGLNTNALLAFANSLSSLAQQIDKLARQGLQTNSGSQNSASFSEALHCACNQLTQTQCSQNSAAQTTVTKSAPLPSWLASAQQSYEADKAHWANANAQQRALWENNPEALRKLQESYYPDGNVRREAIEWLEKNISPHWQACAPHVMETGKLLGTPLPDYLQEHYARYLQMSRTANANSQQTQALWENNPEALRKLQESYHPNINVRREAIEWLEKNISPHWRACAPNVMETGRMLAALGESSSSLAA